MIPVLDKEHVSMLRCADLNGLSVRAAALCGVVLLAARNKGAVCVCATNLVSGINVTSFSTAYERAGIGAP